MHKHHVIPRHLGGGKGPVVEVTEAEHALIHHNLWQLDGRWQDYIAWKALSGQINKQEAIRLAARNGQLGRKHSKEEKRKRIETRRRNGGPWHTRETKEKIGESNKGKKPTNGFQKGNTWGKANTWSKGRKLSDREREIRRHNALKQWDRQRKVGVTSNSTTS